MGSINLLTVGRHLVTYLFSGVFGLGEAIKIGLTVSNGDRQALFAPFPHYRKFDGSEYFRLNESRPVSLTY